MSDTNRQDAFWNKFWNKKKGWREIAGLDFEKSMGKGLPVKAYCELADAYYSMRSPIPSTFSEGLTAAKKLARIALAQVSESKGNLSANQMYVLSTILKARPATVSDLATAEVIASLGIREFPNAQPHTRAFLRLTLAELAYAKGEILLVKSLCGEVEGILTEIDQEARDDEGMLHVKRQKIRVLKRLGALLVKTKNAPVGYKYIHDALSIAREVSKDQFWKILWLLAGLILWEEEER